MTDLDPIVRLFLERQAEEGCALVRASDIVEIEFFDAQHVMAYYSCRGLVKEADGAIREANYFQVGIYFGADHLRRVNPLEVLTLFGPPNCFHPNVQFGGPAICAGHIAAGIGLVDLLYQTYEILSYQRLTPREDDALNLEACRWARGNLARFPVDRRPLKRRQLHIESHRL